MWDPNVSINFRSPLMMCDQYESSCSAFDSTKTKQLTSHHPIPMIVKFFLNSFRGQSRGSDSLHILCLRCLWVGMFRIAILSLAPRITTLYPMPKQCIRFVIFVLEQTHTKFGHFSEIIIFPFCHYRTRRSFARSWLHFAKWTTPRQ